MFCGGVQIREGGPNPLADMDRGGPNPLADLDRGVQIRGGVQIRCDRRYFRSQNNRQKFGIFSCQSLGKFEATHNRRRRRFLRLTAVKVR